MTSVQPLTRRNLPRESVAPARRTKPRRGERRVALLFLLPALVFFPLMFFYPIIAEFLTSLRGGPNAVNPVGSRNYHHAVTDPSVRHAFDVTLKYALGSLVCGIALGLLLAVILNQRIRARALLRGVLLVPYLTSISIVGLLWRNILDPQVGILNRLLTAVHLPQQEWLTTHPLATLVAITVWQQTGYMMVLFLAGLQGIPEMYYEAARVDGASPWRRFRAITLPMLAPTTAFVSIIGIISMMQQFALPYIVTNGGPGNSTDLYVFHVFQLSFQGGDLGYASALAFLMLIAVLVLAGAQTRLSKRGMGHEQS